MTDEGTEIVRALREKREQLDVLGARLSERLRPPTPGDGLETATGTIRRYESWAMPSGNLVFEMPSRRVEAEFDTLAEADTHADQLNKWLAARPSPDRRYRMFVPPPEPTEAALVACIERIGDLESPAAVVTALLAEVVAGALDEAGEVDRAASDRRESVARAARAEQRERLERREQAALSGPPEGWDGGWQPLAEGGGGVFKG